VNFKHVNPHNVRWLVPTWALNQWTLSATLDGLLTDFYAANQSQRWDAKLQFWVAIEQTATKDWTVAIKTPDAAGEQPQDCGKVFIRGDGWSIAFPLNDILKGCPRADDLYTVYVHIIETEVPLQYVGITKRPWYDRLSQHRNRAANGSRLLFHRALRQHGDLNIGHGVLLTGVTNEAAMHFEEEVVALATLYPLGLNMIPGGAAGIAYLHKLGVTARSAEQRDAAVEKLADKSAGDPKTNPLCSARWEADQDFVNRVICGHGARLSVEQVEVIRSLSSVGRSSSDIASATGISHSRVRRVTDGLIYSRVRQ
jgi:hypothetical protein